VGGEECVGEENWELRIRNRAISQSRNQSIEKSVNREINQSGNQSIRFKEPQSTQYQKSAAVGGDAAAWPAAVSQARWYQQFTAATLFEKGNAHSPALNYLVETEDDSRLTAFVKNFSVGKVAFIRHPYR
jgi:hypothetical protein